MEKYGISFQEMNKKQKVNHIWTYYRYHILTAIISCIVVFTLGKTILFPPPADDVGVMVCGPMYTNETQTQVIDDFKNNFNTGLNITPLSWEGDTEIASVMLEKIPLMVSVGELEILALPEEQFERFAKIYGKDMFTALDEVPELDDVLNEYADAIYTCEKTLDSEGNEIDAEKHTYGIKVKAFPNLTCIDESAEMVVGLTGKMRNKEKAYQMYKYMVGAEELPTMEVVKEGE